MESESRSGPSDRLFVAVVFGVGAVAGAVWAGAALAAATGGHRLEASLGDALVAALRLPDQFQNPARAWPTAARPALPGPLLYWSATAVVAVVAATSVAMVWRQLSPGWVGTRRRHRLGVDTRARFAHPRELAPIIVRRVVRGRFVLGRVGRRLVATEDRRMAVSRHARRRQGDLGAVALVGPTRCGKTAAAVAGILEWRGPAVLASVKTDLMAATLGWRSSLGEWRIFDPTGATRRHTASTSPLRGATTITGAMRAARAVCDAAPRSGIEGGAEYWFGLTEILLTGLFWVARQSNRPMGEVVEWVLCQDRPSAAGPGVVGELLDAARGSPDHRVAERAEWAARYLAGIWALDDRTRSSLYGTASTVVWPWADPAVAAATARQEIDLDWLLSDANTVYVCAPLDDQRRLAPAFGGLLNDLIRQAYRRVSANDQPLDPTLLVVVDEAGNTPLDALPEYASTLAGIGVLLVTIWQSIAQLQRTYGAGADVILTNHPSKVFYAGLSDTASLDYVGRLLGDEEVPTRSHSWGHSGSSTTLATMRAPMVAPHVLRQMPPGDALLVHSTLPPAHLQPRRWWRERTLAARARMPVIKRAQGASAASAGGLGDGGGSGNGGAERAGIATRLRGVGHRLTQRRKEEP